MTLKEFSFAAMGAGGCALLMYLAGGMWIRYVLFLWAWGLCFETITQNLWHYAPDVGHTKLCVPGTDVNLLFPFGWVFLIALSTTAARAFPVFPIKYANYALFTGVIGTIMEISFHKMGYWKYDFDAKFMHIYRPYLPKMLIMGVPLQIVAAYTLVIGGIGYGVMEFLFTYTTG